MSFSAVLLLQIQCSRRIITDILHFTPQTHSNYSCLLTFFAEWTNSTTACDGTV